jgi:hypothetical protein
MNYKYRFFKFVLIGLFPFLLLSCDPAQTLEIRNATKDNVQLTIVFKEGNDYTQQFKEAANVDFLSDTLVIALDTTAQNSVKTFHFGIGHWRVLNQLDSLAANINLIEIKTAESKTLFSTETTIKQFFEERLKGRQDELIEIIID